MDRPAGDVVARRRRGKAAWTLAVLAVVCGELTFSAVGMPVMWLAFPLLIPMYGAGVLLVRELVVRTGGGVPSLILMGLVYELVEDGVGLQALSSPDVYNAAAWGPRVLGVNLTYWELQAGYHIVFSVLIPVVITNLLFPELRAVPYLRRRGLAVTAIAAALGIPLLRVFTAPWDPGYRYQAPVAFLTGLAVVIAVVTILALWILPARRRTAGNLGAGTEASRLDRPPRTSLVGLVGAAATLIFLVLLMPVPPDGPAFGEGAFVYLPMTAAAGIAIGASMLIRRWSGSAGWTDRHRIVLVGGALVAHTLFMAATPLIAPADPLTTAVALISGPVVIVLTVLLLIRLDRRIGAGGTGPGAPHERDFAARKRS